MYPDERQLSKGIQSTTVPARLQTMVDMLVAESTRMEAGCVRRQSRRPPGAELLLQSNRAMYGAFAAERCVLRALPVALFMTPQISSALS
jgi:hypothetical protein